MRRIFPRLLIVVLFTGNAFVLIHPLSQPGPLTTGFSLLLNLFIILGAIYFGAKGILFFSASAILIILLRALRISEFTIFPLILLAATGWICYAHSLKARRLADGVKIELDDIEEEKNILSVELAHSRLENTSLREKAQRYATLKDLTEHLSSTLSLEKTFSLITSESLRIIGHSDASALYLVDKQRQQLSLVSTKLQEPPEAGRVHQAGRGRVRPKQGDIFDRWLLRQRAAFIIEDTKRDFRFNVEDIEANSGNVRSLISAPLISENKLLGILRLENISPGVYNADDLRLLAVISDLAALAIENSLLYQKTQKLAITDGLTGLFLHRYFQQRFEEEIRRCLWTNSQFSFLMLDIDNFKQYNDKYGHIAGDIVLKKVAGLIASSVNPGDIVARYGGEEFGVLLLQAAKAEGQKVAERTRKRIEEKAFVLRRQSTRVRISGGIASFPDDGKRREELIQKADHALYEAKAGGKNRICTY